MNSFGFVTMLALAAVVAVSGEPPVRYRQPFGRGSFGRLQQDPSYARQTAGYEYPKPSGYSYPQPEQPFPLPEEEPPAYTTVAPTTTAVPTTEFPTTTAAVDDYDDNATEDPETETVEAEARAVAARLRAARLRQAPRNSNRQRLGRLEALDNQQPNQEQQRPIYLVNIPESTLQRLVLLNQAQVAAAPLAAAAPIQYAPLTAAAPLQAAPAAFPFAAAAAAPQQVFITDASGLVYAKK